MPHKYAVVEPVSEQHSNIYTMWQPWNGLTQCQSSCKMSLRREGWIEDCFSLSLFIPDMVQLEQYDAGPSVSVEPDANLEVNFYFNSYYYLWVCIVFDNK